MEKIKNKSKTYAQYVSVVVVCVLCFVMGFTVCSFTTGKIHSKKWDKLDTIYSILTEKWFYADKIEDLDTRLVEQAITGMTYLEEDLHTNYFSLEVAKQFSSSLEGSNVGVGFSFYVNADKNFTIIDTFVNSPADIAGLQSGDIVTCVQNMKCAEHDSSDIVTMIKSSENQELTMEFIRDGKKMETKITPVAYDSTVCCKIEDTYGVVELTSFSEISAKEFSESISRIQKKGIKNLIIDLRNNGGGYLKSVLDISSCLLPKDSVVFIENKADGTQAKQLVSNDYEQVKFDSIVILQNKNTASASEVLIGALKDNLGDSVSTVGTQSYGKGTEQVSVPFTDGTSLKYTVAEWITPNETSINLVGFTPDYEVELSEIATVKIAEMEKDEVIKADSVHVNATALQTYLDFLGYKVDRKDGYFSEMSSKALAKFQKDNGLEATGNCDVQTWQTLTDLIVLALHEQDATLDYQMVKAIELVKD